MNTTKASHITLALAITFLVVANVKADWITSSGDSVTKSQVAGGYGTLFQVEVSAVNHYIAWASTVSDPTITSYASGLQKDPGDYVTTNFLQAHNETVPHSFKHDYSVAFSTLNVEYMVVDSWATNSRTAYYGETVQVDKWWNHESTIKDGAHAGSYDPNARYIEEGNNWVAGLSNIETWEGGRAQNINWGPDIGNGSGTSNPKIDNMWDIYDGDKNSVYYYGLNVDGTMSERYAATVGSVIDFTDWMWESIVFDFTVTRTYQGHNVGTLNLFMWGDQLHTNFEPDPNAVPEPATLAVLGLGLAGLGLARARRKK